MIALEILAFEGGAVLLRRLLALEGGAGNFEGGAAKAIEIQH